MSAPGRGERPRQVWYATGLLVAPGLYAGWVAVLFAAFAAILPFDGVSDVLGGFADAALFTAFLAMGGAFAMHMRGRVAWVASLACAALLALSFLPAVADGDVWDGDLTAPLLQLVLLACSLGAGILVALDPARSWIVASDA